MKLNATYIKIRDKWWGLPLFLPSLILPIFAHINTFAHISSGEVFSLLSAFGTDDQHDDVFQLGGIARDRLRDFCPQICRAWFLRNALING